MSNTKINDLNERRSVNRERIDILAEMEKAFEERNITYFKKLLKHDDYVIRTRAVCILADIGNEDVIEDISEVLLKDPNALVRHEAAFSLGQMGFRRAIPALSRAVESDESFFVRHEAAIALGVIGSEEARGILSRALSDRSEEVRESAIVALSNLDYLANVRSTSKFAKLTGG